MRIDNKLCKHAAIPVEKLHPFEGHPYKVLDDEEMEALTESIHTEGVISPLIVRPLNDADGYEVISGHRRLHAAQRAGLSKVPPLSMKSAERRRQFYLWTATCTGSISCPVKRHLLIS